jgi:hypothetical protein
MATLQEFLRDAGPGDLAPHLPPVEHFSFSQINLFRTCEEMYRRRYVLGEKERPSGNLIVGGAFHTAMEHNFNHVIEHGYQHSTDDVLELYHTAFTERVEADGGADEIIWDSKPETERAGGAGATRAYRESVGQFVEPVAVEQSFEISIPGVPLPVVGKIDVVQRKTQIDLKTANKAQYSIKSSWLLQGETYMLATGLPVEWHVAVKGTSPKAITPLERPALLQPLLKDGRQVHLKYQQFVKKLAWLMREFGPDNPWPDAKSHPWACNFCGWGPKASGKCFWWQS